MTCQKGLLASMQSLVTLAGGGLGEGVDVVAETVPPYELDDMD